MLGLDTFRGNPIGLTLSGEFVCASGDAYFCPLEGHTFTCTAVVPVTQENMNDGQIYHEVEVTAEPPSGGDTIKDQYHLHFPLEGDSSILIGESC